jgi:hypothetical protein
MAEPKRMRGSNMQVRHIAAVAAFALLTSTAVSGCATLYHRSGYTSGGQAAPDSASMDIVVNNENDQAVRVILHRGANTEWIGTVASMSTQAMRIPADIPGGGGAFTIRVLTIGGQEWDARGIVPQGGSTVRVHVDRVLRMSTWSTP